MNLEKLSGQVWVLHEFLDESTAALLVDDISSLNDDVWYTNDVDDSSFWYGRNLHISKLSEQAQEAIKDAEIRLSSVFSGYSKIHDIQSVLRTITDGKSLGEHRDNSAENDITNMFGLIIYLNTEYSGGEIYYKDLGVDYKPRAGDLVVHYAGLVHGVKKVTEGIRYILTSFVKGDSDTRFMGEVSGG